MYEMPDKQMNRFQFVSILAEKSGLTWQQAKSVLNTIKSIVSDQLGQQGPGEVLIPGLLKLVVVDRPATPQHEGVNPFTNKPMTYPAKAARKVIRARLLPALRDGI
jgi:DNA-binding protein HU-beta